MNDLGISHRTVSLIPTTRKHPKNEKTAPLVARISLAQSGTCLNPLFVLKCRMKSRKFTTNLLKRLSPKPNSNLWIAMAGPFRSNFPVRFSFISKDVVDQKQFISLVFRFLPHTKDPMKTNGGILMLLFKKAGGGNNVVSFEEFLKVVYIMMKGDINEKFNRIFTFTTSVLILSGFWNTSWWKRNPQSIWGAVSVWCSLSVRFFFVSKFLISRLVYTGKQDKDFNSTLIEGFVDTLLLRIQHDEEEKEDKEDPSSVQDPLSSPKPKREPNTPFTDSSQTPTLSLLQSNVLEKGLLEKFWAQL